MPNYSTLALLAASIGLAACTQPAAPRAAGPAMSGTAAGGAVDPLSAASRDRAGEGCPNASPGAATIVGNTTTGHPRIAYASQPATAGAGNPNVRLPPGGEANTCN